MRKRTGRVPIGSAGQNPQKTRGIRVSTLNPIGTPEGSLATAGVLSVRFHVSSEYLEL